MDADRSLPMRMFSWITLLASMESGVPPRINVFRSNFQRCRSTVVVTISLTSSFSLSGFVGTGRAMVTLAPMVAYGQGEEVGEAGFGSGSNERSSGLRFKMLGICRAFSVSSFEAVWM